MRRIPGLLTALVLTGLVVLTALRFLHTGFGPAVQLASFSSYAVVGFGVVLLGCALALRGATRTRWTVLAAAVAVVGLVVQGWAVLPLYVGGASGRSDLTVMTSNLEFGRGDAVTVVRTVAADGVDVLVLEEVSPQALSKLLGAGLTDVLPHQLGTPVASAAGTMVFSRFTLGGTTAFTLGNGGLDTMVGAPEPFRLLAVHTSQPVVAPRPWLADMDRVRERAALAVAQGPTLVLGDFNATLDHEPLRAVLRAGLRDAAEAAGSGWQPTWPTRYRESWLRPLVAIDHVLTSPEYDAIRTHTVEVSDTDHLAVVATLRLRKGD